MAETGHGSSSLRNFGSRGIGRRYSKFIQDYQQSHFQPLSTSCLKCCRVKGTIGIFPDFPFVCALLWSSIYCSQFPRFFGDRSSNVFDSNVCVWRKVRDAHMLCVVHMHGLAIFGDTVVWSYCSYIVEK